MSWMQKLYETYENCQSAIGTTSDENETSLLSICHTTQMAQIEIVIDGVGNFRRASVVSKEQAKTIIPCTENSGGRSGIRPVNHPLCDKLQYIAGDFVEYGGEVTIGYTKNPKEPYENYIGLLRQWCESDNPHMKAKAILIYVEKGNVISDLIENKILFIGNDKKLIKKWKGDPQKEIPEIFKVTLNSTQADAFVRWIIEIPNDPQTTVWTDKSLFNSWIRFYSSTKEKQGLCYVTGIETFMADQHPFKIRNDADKAKLISSKDKSGFTFKGRFLTAGQACGVGFEVTQKAHNALRWLIKRQGFQREGLAIVAWSTVGKDIPDPLADPFSLLGMDKVESDSDILVATSEELAIKMRKKITGYQSEIGDTTEVVVMGVDSATTGRMAMIYYRELMGSEFLQRIEGWHKSCCWIHDYHTTDIIDKGTGKKNKVKIRFVGAPAPTDIAEAAYGSKVDDKLRKKTVTRILPCIIDGQRIPRDLVESAVRRATNQVGMESWEWSKTLSIACAIYRKYHEKEHYEMALDETRITRDYLYGRLLALADGLEKWALNKAGENRQTNAARLMQRFADHPYTTWRIIYLALGPYKARLGNGAAKMEVPISKVTAMFAPNDFTDDKRLSGEFLLGYYCQKEALWQEKNKA